MRENLDRPHTEKAYAEYHLIEWNPQGNVEDRRLPEEFSLYGDL